jgi:uncharacterized protein (DUF1501 family)
MTDRRGCDDFHLSARRGLFQRAARGVLPVPQELLDEGGERFFGAPRSRRNFLAGGVGMMLGLTAATRMPPWHLLEGAVAEAATGAPILVTVYLSGGNDGLNTLVPLAGNDHAIYTSKRTRIALDPATTLPVLGHAELGWHPQATGFKTLMDAGKVAAFLGVDYPNPSYSHFDSAYFWRTGQLGNRATTGWLGNYLDRYGSKTNPLQGVAVEWGTDDILHTQRAPTCALFAPDQFTFYSPGVWNEERMMRLYATLSTRAGNTGRKRAMSVLDETVVVRQKLKPLAAQDPSKLPPPPIAYPDSGTGEALRNLARMLGAGLGIRVATVEADGSFDTHDGQLDTHGKDLADAADALVAFQADLAARGLEDRVVTLVWSEFGRRVEDNDSGGTDHGAGSTLFVVGKHVKPGVSASWNLARNAAYDGNVPVAVDFRDVYAGILAYHLKADPKDCLPAYRGHPIRVVA